MGTCPAVERDHGRHGSDEAGAVCSRRSRSGRRRVSDGGVLAHAVRGELASDPGLPFAVPAVFVSLA